MQHVQQHARLRRFHVAQSLARLPLLEQQFDHRVIRGDFVLEETLLLALAAADLCAQGFDDGDGFVEGATGLGGLVEGAVSLALYRANLPERIAVADARGEGGRARGRGQCLRVLSSRGVQARYFLQRFGDPQFAAQRFTHRQTLPVMLHRHVELPLLAVEEPDALQHRGHARLIPDLLAQGHAPAEMFERQLVAALRLMDVPDAAEQEGDLAFIPLLFLKSQSLLKVFEGQPPVALRHVSLRDGPQRLRDSLLVANRFAALQPLQTILQRHAVVAQQALREADVQQRVGDARLVPLLLVERQTSAVVGQSRLVITQRAFDGPEVVQDAGRQHPVPRRLGQREAFPIVADR